MPKVTMPQLGESVAEGTIGKWLKQVGEHVDKYEPIVEVITDKVNAEVPSPFAGTLTAILVQEGETVPNNAEIAEIDGEGAASSNGSAPVAAEAHGPAGSDERPAPVAATTTAPSAARPEPTEYEGRLTPAVRRLAREHDIDLALVNGTGHAGRITREDILAYVEAQRTGRAPAPAAPTPAPAAATPRRRDPPRPRRCRSPPTRSSPRPRCAKPSPRR